MEVKNPPNILKT